jgi:hypothetical protein
LKDFRIQRKRGKSEAWFLQVQDAQQGYSCPADLVSRTKNVWHLRREKVLFRGRRLFFKSKQEPWGSSAGKGIGGFVDYVWKEQR